MRLKPPFASSPVSHSNGAISRIPRHLAVIMDGNGRWAKHRLLARLEGHRAGAKTVRMIVEQSRRLGIRYLTLFAFSTENWQRPRDEVSGLMGLFADYLDKEIGLLMENGIRLRSIGAIHRLPVPVVAALRRAEERTQAGSEMELILAVSYGGREEIVSAARSLAEEVQRGEREPSSIDEALFASRLYTSDVPDPDLLLRSSGEHRISNFLLWQLAYSEIVVTPVLWPDLNVEELHRCLAEYGARVRRFGLTEEQLTQPSDAAGTE